MKKIILVFAIFLATIISINANAQDTAIHKGDNLISATIGFGSIGYTSNISMPPITVSYEHIVYEFGNYWSIGAGAFGGVLSQRDPDGNIVAGTVCAQGNVHFCPTSKWDIYTGIGLGVAFASVRSNSSSSANAGGFGWAYMLGARYFFSDKFGVNLQLGGLGICNLGVSFKF